MPVTGDNGPAHDAVDALISSIKSALLASGVDLSRARPEDLKPVDEFHTGGVTATDALLSQLQITPETLVLDIGAGLGGTARHIAGTCGANVTGIDLNEVNVLTARHLSKLVGMDHCTAFQQGSALELRFMADSFDLVTMFHVGMNIDDKEALMAEVHRVLAPGGTFALFDVMAIDVDRPDMAYPLPWAEAEAQGFVDRAGTYRGAARAAGFDLLAECDRSAVSLAFFDGVMAGIDRHGVPPLGIHLLMGGTARTKVENYMNAVRDGIVAPCEMILRKAA